MPAKVLIGLMAETGSRQLALVLIGPPILASGCARTLWLQPPLPLLPPQHRSEVAQRLLLRPVELPCDDWLATQHLPRALLDVGTAQQTARGTSEEPSTRISGLVQDLLAHLVCRGSHPALRRAGA